jgi:hypothetical protein
VVIAGMAGPFGGVTEGVLTMPCVTDRAQQK